MKKRVHGMQLMGALCAAWGRPLESEAEIKMHLIKLSRVMRNDETQPGDEVLRNVEVEARCRDGPETGE